LWLYEVTGKGWWFENGEYTGQRSSVSGTVLVEVTLIDVGPPYDIWWVMGRGDFDLEFSGHHFATADEDLASTSDRAVLHRIGDIFFIHEQGVGDCYDPKLAGGCFAGWYTLERMFYRDWLAYVDGYARPEGEAPLWIVGADDGLFPEYFFLSNGRPVPDPGSTLLLFGTGLVGLRAWRKWRQ
jgi:hypothetical protein